MDEIEDTILRLVRERGPDKSICPTEAARALSPEWRAKLKAVRATALRMAGEGRLLVLRHGKPVENFAELRGVIRLRLAPATR